MTRRVLPARFNMTATVMSQEGVAVGAPPIQDPDTGEIIHTWTVDSDPVVWGTQKRSIDCIARGVSGSGLRGTGTSVFYNADGSIRVTDFIRIQYGAGVVLARHDRITDVTNSKGVLLWKEEEHNNTPTIFEVLGVVPIVDPFGRHIENSALCQRVETQ